MKTKQQAHRFAPAVTMVLAAFTLAGCGNGDDTSPATVIPDASPDVTQPVEASTTDAGTDATLTDSGKGDGGDAGETTADLVARGQYLVTAVASCGDCHTPRTQTGAPDTTKTLAGSAGEFVVPGLGPDGGVVGAPNITQDMATGIGSWTDAQIKSAIVGGVDNDGKALFPIMPYFVFANMTDDDANAIVAYLRTVPAVSNTIPERNFAFAQPAMAVPAADIPDPIVEGADASTDAAADSLLASATRGKYLAGNVGVCMECHTAHVQGPVPLDVTKLFAGGEVFAASDLGLPAPPFPSNIVSANITPSATGLQGWTATQVVAALKQGVDISGAPLCPPMPSGPNGAFGHLTDGDALDIANYVTHLPPIANTISPICHQVLAASMPGDAGPGDAGASDAAPE